MAAKQTTTTTKSAKSTKSAPAVKQDGRKIHIQDEAAKKVKFREGTARYEWWQRIQGFNNKPLSAFLEDVKANPPSVPTKGKLQGKLEPPQGWIKFFIREGLIKTSDA